MPFKKRPPILTMFVPAFCANCRRPYGEDNYKFTLVGTETRCVWLCNNCFIRLYKEAAEKEKREHVEVVPKGKEAQRDKARRVGQTMTNGKTLLEHIDNGEEQ